LLGLIHLILSQKITIPSVARIWNLKLFINGKNIDEIET